jgi:hypothetical protein
VTIFVVHEKKEKKKDQLRKNRTNMLRERDAQKEIT